MILFLLCTRCTRAWTAPAITPCDLCGEAPCSISPFAGERRVWFGARIGKDRAPGIFAAAYYTDRREHKRSLARAIAAKGNTTARLEAA